MLDRRENSSSARPRRTHSSTHSRGSRRNRGIRGSGQLSQGAYQRHEGYGGRLPRKREKTVPGKTFRV